MVNFITVVNPILPSNLLRPLYMVHIDQREDHIDPEADEGEGDLLFSQAKRILHDQFRNPTILPHGGDTPCR